MKFIFLLPIIILIIPNCYVVENIYEEEFVTEYRITREEFKILVIVISLGIAGMLGIDLHLASMPYIMQTMQTDKVHMQQSVSIYLLGAGLSLLIYGPLSDKMGRKPIIIMGVSIAALASLWSVFTTHINIFLLSRLVQGIGAAACIGIGRTIITDVLSGHKLATVGSYFSMLTSLSPLLAPTLGGYIQHWFGWQANFILLSAILLITLFIYIIFCPETNQHINAHAFRLNSLCNNYLQIARNKAFLIYTLIAGIGISIGIVYATASSFIFQTEFHLSPVAYGWLGVIVGVAGMLGKFMGATMIRFFGMNRTLSIGFIFPLIGGLLLLVIQFLGALSVSHVMVGIFIAILGQFFILPNTLAGAMQSFPTMKGAAGALYGSSQTLISFLTGALVAFFAAFGVTTLSASYAILGIVGLIVFFMLLKPIIQEKQ
ncbi:MAG: hypothetical protein A3E87_01520 [Gammaproteobacteria bacterium RIFCSPHIGHO2_12_FULL_35_23]|nr:MAG: hypothetical protein A3E87_01520 [Gammaproteobacteria bacterium RIFCSPHIGHO2_12_FULL_35_23]